MKYLLYGLIGFVLLLNLSATRILLKDEFPSTTQRLVQMIIIWLVPIFGAVIVIGIIAAHHTPAEMKSMAIWPFYLADVPKKRKMDGDGSGICGSDNGGGEGGCGSD